VFFYFKIRSFSKILEQIKTKDTKTRSNNDIYMYLLYVLVRVEKNGYICYSKNVNVLGNTANSPMIKGEMKFSSNYPFEKFVLQGSVFPQAKGNGFNLSLVKLSTLYLNVGLMWKCLDS